MHTKIGFEESKDFVIALICSVLNRIGLTHKEIRDRIKQEGKIINIVKESNLRCGIASIYEFNGKKYLVRGQDETTDIRVPVGEISDSDLASILEQGYEGRSQRDRAKLEIQKELAKWSDEEFLETTRMELCEYVNGLDNIFHERYKKLIGELNPGIKERALDTLKKKGLFDDDMRYIEGSNIVKFDNEIQVANGGYMNGSIIVNPNSAKQFYDAYVDFIDCKRDGIREDIDYSKPLSELSDLSSLEVLYWHYFNKKPYQEFLKSTMLHENVHRWTLEGNTIDDPIDTYVMEGYVEQEARAISDDYNIEYARCFRNDEINFINYLSRGNKKTDNEILMLCNRDPAQCLLNGVKFKIIKDIEGVSSQRLSEVSKKLYTRFQDKIGKNKTSNFGKNFREVFAGIKPDKSYQLIDLIENEISKIESKKKIHSLDEFHDVARETVQGVRTEEKFKQENKKNLGKHNDNNTETNLRGNSTHSDGDDPR